MPSAFVQTGAARMFSQFSAAPDHLAQEILELLSHPQKRVAMQSALADWNAPAAAGDIAERILNWPAPRSILSAFPGPN